jgi:hypothetical protein
MVREISRDPFRSGFRDSGSADGTRTGTEPNPDTLCVFGIKTFGPLPQRVCSVAPRFLAIHSVAGLRPDRIPESRNTRSVSGSGIKGFWSCSGSAPQTRIPELIQGSWFCESVLTFFPRHGERFGLLRLTHLKGFRLCI